MTPPKLGLHTTKRWVRLGLAAWVLTLLGLAACGGSTTDGAASAQADAKTYCDRAVELGCDIIDDCPAFIADARADSAKQSCTREFDAALSCLGRTLSSCQDDPGDLCPEELEHLDECDNANDPPPNACSFGISGGTNPACQLSCDRYAAECANGRLDGSCSCTAGPKVGQRIVANCDNLPQIADTACR